MSASIFMSTTIPDSPNKSAARAGHLLGVVLSGGESRRMGCDKGLLQTNGRPWVLRMGDKLAGQHLPVVYSINPTQVSAYSALLPTDSWVVDADEREGPLNGLLTVHRHYPGDDLLLVACDMQDLDAATLSRLIAAYGEGDAGFYAYEVEGVLQPLCAIYTAKALASASSAIAARSPQDLLHRGKLRRLSGAAAAFRNYNTL